MYRKIALAGVTAAVIIGAGTAALATSGSDTTSGSAKPSTTKSSTTAKQHHKKGAAGALRRSVHGEFTTKGKTGYVSHSVIRGSVTSVSATAITVKAKDGYSETFTIASTTKVRERPAAKKGKATASTISAVKSGDLVAVMGKAAETTSGTAGTATATVVIDGLKK